jgi:chromosome segregation ATPase
MALQNKSEVAAQWAETREELARAEDELRRARDREEHLRSRLNTLSEMLAKSVGSNIQTRAYDVGKGRVVLVQHGQSIKLVETEPCAAPAVR